MWRAILAAVLAIAPLMAANIRLFLTDGGYHLVREYKVLSDRVRYYSVERGEWEEIPLELVDLKKTEAFIREREEAQREQAAVMDEEEREERRMREEAARVPMEPGVYFVEGDQLTAIKQAESKIQANKRRAILKAIAPIPIVSGKSTVELDGEKSQTVIRTDKPEFYIRLSADQRFGIAQLKPKKGARVVDEVEKIPVSEEIFEKIEMVDVFRRQVSDGVYKIWPVNPLKPGEYAVVEYTEGKVNVQVWDFSCQPLGK